MWIFWLKGWFCEKCYELYYKDITTFEEFIECYDVDLGAGEDSIDEMEILFKEALKNKP